jgi:uncharacterized protein (TIGR03435 family)
VLAPLAGRVIVNRAGLDGNWDFDLDYAPDQSSQPGAPAPSASDAPSLFPAMQEQLGLKLESGRAPVPVVSSRAGRAHPKTDMERPLSR